MMHEFCCCVLVMACLVVFITLDCYAALASFTYMLARTLMDVYPSRARLLRLFQDTGG